MLTRYDLTLGSVIRLESGFKYRSEGWYDLTEKHSAEDRGPNSIEAVTVIDALWWASYVYRGINLSKPGAYLPDFDVSGIRIYAKI